MRHSINILEFSNGVNLGQFHGELLKSTFASNIQGVGMKGSNGETEVYVDLSANLTSEQQVEFVSFAQAHVKYEPTEIELRSKDLEHQLDYFGERNQIKELVTAKGYENLNDAEKAHAAEYCMLDDATCVDYYMSLGDDLQTAQTRHLVKRSIHIDNAAKSCRMRSDCPAVKYIAIKHMEEVDAMSFIDAIRNYLEDYSFLAHLGLEYGHSREGIMDYIEATNSYVSAGLSTYNFRTGTSYEACRDEFKNLLVYGIKPGEFDLFSL